MALVVNATPGSATANSYLTVAEAQAYFDARLPVEEWDNADSQEALVVMATRVIDAVLRPLKILFPGKPPYYIARRTWTGLPTAPGTQRLAWPRTGMLDRNGAAIDPNVIPQDLKDAVAEMAGQLAKGDRTADNDAITQGIKSLSAGSVSITFKDAILPQPIPDMVYELLPTSWLTDELYLPAMPAEFDVVQS